MALPIKRRHGIHVILILVHTYKFFNGKIHTTFVQDHVDAWVKSILRESTENSMRLIQTVYDAGVETLFNIDNLKQKFDADSNLFKAIKHTVSSTLQAVAILPRLFASYTEALRRHRGALFGSASQKPDDVVGEVQNCGMQFYNICKSVMDTAEQSQDIWAIKTAFLKLLEEGKLYNDQQAHSKMSLCDDLERAIAGLESNGSAPPFVH